MHCWSCGSELPEDSNFCHKCGVRVRGSHRASSPETGPSTATAEEPVDGESARESQAGETGPLSENVAPEREVWSGRPNFRSLAGRFTFAAVCFLGVVLAFTLGYHPIKQRDLVEPVFFLAVAFFVVLGLWLLVSMAKTKLTLKYRLTTERLFIERGFLSRRTEEVDLLRVDDATVHQGRFDRLADVGNIVIASTEPADPLYIIVGVQQPVELKEKIRQHTRELRRRSLTMNND
jgi:membrane protein YdbS with pleckstrin-like domain